jgi:hypothetical protein
MTDKEAMKLALFALDIVKIHYTQSRHINEAITALKERFADPMREVQRLGQEIEQEPICPECKAEVLYECVACSSNNYPPQRTWVGLTDDDDIDWEEGGNLKDLVKTIEAKLKQKNGYAEEKNAICSPFMISELWKLQK